MNRKRPPIPAIILILLVLAFSIYFIVTQAAGNKNGALTASGTIEATQINVSPELAGKVKEVLVDEGQSVKAGDPLLHLDDSLLSAQRAVAASQLDSAKAALTTAQAAYETAQQQYNTTLSAALNAERSTRTSTWDESKPSEFNQPTWYFSKEEQITAAQADVDAKQQALQDANAKLDETSKKAGSAQFLEVEATLAKARIAFENAQTVFDQTSGASDGQDLRDEAQLTLDDAKIDLDNAQKDYDDALTTDGATDVLQARAKVMVAQEAYDTALDQLRALQTGADSEQVVTAGKAANQAKAALDQAQTSVNTAQANLDLLDTQMEKLTIYAPMDGVILERNVEPGEFVQPGAIAFSMADLSSITITVYVPEDRYGQISLGQAAEVTVDSFPGIPFNAEVTNISDQAEFTPRNVQTVEGRSSTVYAIKLKVTDLEGKLKIGMPADVEFK